MLEATPLKIGIDHGKISRDGPFVLGLKCNYIVYVEHLPMILNQCVTMMDVIEHVATYAMMIYIQLWIHGQD